MPLNVHIMTPEEEEAEREETEKYARIAFGWLTVYAYILIAMFVLVLILGSCN